MSTPKASSLESLAVHRGPRRHAPRAAALSLLTGFVLIAGGCAVKGADNANLILGKQQFVAKCGSCHTLARANTKGNVGPNLDQAFHASIAETPNARNAIRGIVEQQIAIPNPEGAMRPDLVTGATARDVAAYVAQVADAPGQDSGLLAKAIPTAGGGAPAQETAGKLKVPADPTGQLAYATKSASATAGSVTIEMPNASGVNHNIAIEQGSGTGKILGASSFISTGSTSFTVTLKPGTYTFFCQVPTHRENGMFGTLIVK